MANFEEDKSGDETSVLVQFFKLDASWDQHRILQSCPESENGYFKVSPSAILDGALPNAAKQLPYHDCLVSRDLNYSTYLGKHSQPGNAFYIA